MAEYKWSGPTRDDGVTKGNMFIPAAMGNKDWRAFLEWEAEGNVPDPWRTRDELEAAALAALLEAYRAEVDKYTGFIPQKKAAKVSKALRKEAKGTANAADLKILDDNDLEDSWLDDMESRMEVDELWIEQTATDEELLSYDPSLIDWPYYPI